MTVPRFAVLLILLLCCGLLFPKMAHAATTCTATMTDLQFGSVDSTGFATASGTLSWQCSTSEFIASSPAQIKLCFAIGAGSATGSTTNARLMRSAAPNNDPMSFQITQDPAFTDPWTESTTPPSSAEIAPSYELTSLFGLFASGSGSGSMPVYARVPAQVLAAGNYSNAFTGANARIVYRYSYGGTAPASCSTGSTGGESNVTFTARATVPGLCNISTASDLDFGASPGTIAANVDSTSGISMQCRNRTAWNVGLDNGMNAMGTTRRMRRMSGSDYVNYELYSNTGRSTRWGNVLNVSTLSGTGSGGNQTLTVFGRVPAPQTAPPGNYKDVVTVTVTY